MIESGQLSLLSRICSSFYRARRTMRAGAALKQDNISLFPCEPSLSHMQESRAQGFLHSRAGSLCWICFVLCFSYVFPLALNRCILCFPWGGDGQDWVLSFHVEIGTGTKEATCDFRVHWDLKQNSQLNKRRLLYLVLPPPCIYLLWSPEMPTI